MSSQGKRLTVYDKYVRLMKSYPTEEYSSLSWEEARRKRIIDRNLFNDKELDFFSKVKQQEFDALTPNRQSRLEEGCSMACETASLRGVRLVANVDSFMEISAKHAYPDFAPSTSSSYKPVRDLDSFAFDLTVDDIELTPSEKFNKKLEVPESNRMIYEALLAESNKQKATYDEYDPFDYDDDEMDF